MNPTPRKATEPSLTGTGKHELSCDTIDTVHLRGGNVCRIES